MTTADKKRILTTPTAMGELIYKGIIIPFRCLYTSNKSSQVCMMIGELPDSELHVVCLKSALQLWNFSDMVKRTNQSNCYIKTSLNIPYSEIKIIWARYAALTDTLNLNAA